MRSLIEKEQLVATGREGAHIHRSMVGKTIEEPSMAERG